MVVRATASVKGAERKAAGRQRTLVMVPMSARTVRRLVECIVRDL